MLINQPLGVTEGRPNGRAKLGPRNGARFQMRLESLDLNTKIQNYLMDCFALWGICLLAASDSRRPA